MRFRSLTASAPFATIDAGLVPLRGNTSSPWSTSLPSCDADDIAQQSQLLGDNNAQGSSSTIQLNPINFCYPHPWGCTGQLPTCAHANCWPCFGSQCTACHLFYFQSIGLFPCCLPLLFLQVCNQLQNTQLTWSGKKCRCKEKIVSCLDFLDKQSSGE